ncbi:MAG: UvrD-helicase domain-containing protein [Chloroflexi bacterium]|nr:UvrD-helicase domain-containing protein [Chloroflexota bacterium]
MLKGLNEQQRAAVTAGDGPVLVLAGPGSGKTRVLTHRIAYLAQERNVRAWHIMAVTFTNKAAREMENRVLGMLGESGKLDGLSIGTFHAICARILRVEADYTTFTRDYAIFDTEDQLAVMSHVVGDLNLDPKTNTPRSLLSKVSAAKNELIAAREYQPSEYRDEKIRRAYQRYDELLRENNARDFDDLLMHTVQLFQQNADVLERYQRRYQYVLVDEFQDTNIAQYTLVRLLAGERRCLFAVGDPDQSIYAFRGADYRNVKRFAEDHPDAQVIMLEENYRSHQAILNAAMGVIDQNTDRTKKNLFSQRKKGPLATIYEAYSEDDEAHYVVETITDLVSKGEYKPGDFAIMYRTNAQSRALEDGFRRANMPYRLVGATSFYSRKEIKDVMAYLRLTHNPSDNVSFERIVNVPTRGIGQKTIETMITWARDQGMSPPQALFMLLDDKIDSPLSSRARAALVGFAKMLQEWRRVRDDLMPAELISKVLKDTGYISYLDDGTEQGQSRIENVLELRGYAERYNGLPLVTFLEEISLVSDVDTPEDDLNRPSLMTLHSAKGLEFPVVFITGVEENILPHSRSIAPERRPGITEDERQEGIRAVEEERRLMYVGITRAEQRLYLLYATMRSLYGDSRSNLPSRFLYDIPDAARNGSDLPRRGVTEGERRSYQAMTTWAAPASYLTRSEETPKSSAKTRFRGGDVVFHAKYGEGVVISAKVAGGLEQVDVMFPGIGGQKTIIADFLKKVES